MADSFAAVLMGGLLSVQEASSDARFECFSPGRTTGIRCVLDVQKFIDH
ncbi:TPA: hypothetical protein ACNRRD_005507 [Pseudomonas aeruginosa]|nr:MULTISPECIES: hypothetical protein [Pseudomonas]EJV1366113.1 hypothetical protein [Pseudomonas aeruginosa]EJV1382917.1 hypothetical protein [Pseudomonas aeruginosa]EJV1606438.1 hypothetical protein [Pseudomonas aeruginosa]EKD1562855.1 hypothetical protein [Pseudomonas aeruginosa]EKJ6946615.1 hypothetical protein [Pseudomonas aeruginosa]